MRRLLFALIARQEGDRYEVFPPVDTIGLSCSFDLDAGKDSDADREDAVSWKRRIRHYAAMEGWFAVFFAECTEHNYLRSFGFEETAIFQGDANYATFPVRRVEDHATETESTDSTNAYATCDVCTKPIEGEPHYICRPNIAKDLIVHKQCISTYYATERDRAAAPEAAERERINGILRNQPPIRQDTVFPAKYGYCAHCGDPLKQVHHHIRGENLCGKCVDKLPDADDFRPKPKDSSCTRCGDPIGDSPYAIKGEPVCKDCAGEA